MSFPPPPTDTDLLSYSQAESSAWSWSQSFFSGMFSSCSLVLCGLSGSHQFVVTAGAGKLPPNLAIQLQLSVCSSTAHKLRMTFTFFNRWEINEKKNLCGSEELYRGKVLIFQSTPV